MVTTYNLIPLFIPKWAMYPGNSKYQMLQICIVKLKKLHQQVKEYKTCKVLADRDHKILATDIIPDDWNAKCTMIVANIKEFF